MNETNIKIKQFSPYISMLILFLVAVGIFIFLLLPQFGNFQDSRQIKKDADNQLESVSTELLNLKDTVTQIDALSEGQKVTVEKAMPIGENLEDFLRNLDKLAQSSGAIITNLNIFQDTSGNGDLVEGEKLEKNGQMIKSNISMSVRANETNFMKFLKSLENNARLIDVSAITLNHSTSATDTTDNLNINIEAVSYYLDGIQKDIAFPYGYVIDTSIFDLAQFQNLSISY